MLLLFMEAGYPVSAGNATSLMPVLLHTTQKAEGTRHAGLSISSTLFVLPDKVAISHRNEIFTSWLG